MADNLYNDLEKLKIDHVKNHPFSLPRKWLLWFIISVLIIVVALFLLKAMLFSNKHIAIITVYAQVPREISSVMTAGGYIVAESEITVSSKVAGRIATLQVREGDLVKKDDIIAVLDNEELQVQMEEAAAHVEKARLNVQHKRELYEKDVVDLSRRKELFRENLISPSQLDKEEKTLVIAQLELDRAQSELEVCKKKLHLTKIRLEESTIRAPISGTVIDKVADRGEMLFPMKTMEGTSGSAIVTLADLTVMNVEIDINEDDIEKIQLGNRALITPDSFPDKTYQGTVIEVSPMANRQKNVVPIKVRITEPDKYLKPDMSARVTFQKKEADGFIRESVITIPRDAVVKKHDKNIVFVIENAQAREREVQLGAFEGASVVIEKGLVDGEKIAVEGHERLTAGDTVIF
jgi:RND family efflux transporter MFP subunit